MGSSMTKGTGWPRKAVFFRISATRMPTIMPVTYSPIMARALLLGKKAAANTA